MEIIEKETGKTIIFIDGDVVHILDNRFEIKAISDDKKDNE